MDISKHTQVVPVLIRIRFTFGVQNTRPYTSTHNYTSFTIAPLVS